MQYYPFDSRSKIYRNRIGAIAEGTNLRLRLLLHKDALVKSAFLLVKRDMENEPVEILLSEGEFLENYRFYDCELELEEGLYWYSFRYLSEHGEFFVTKTDTSLGIVSADGGWWQQTVYSKAFSTPDWIKGGIIYQIFPDRFYASGEKKKNIPEDRYIVSDWSKQPEYRQKNGMCSLGNDYYGGDLKGIIKKLPYLSSLGVSCIYLNPIFEAHSNHRYNTADYLKIDPHLGDEATLKELCETAESHGISVILDGVFSHTGDDSVYFNKYNRYNSCGAFNSYDSPYRKWYKFKDYPQKYESWWGILTLPEINENDETFTDFITGKDGVLKYWLKTGIKGWRLDVADELPDEFLDNLRKSVKSADKDAYILGEVWEDASNKISYGIRRRFLRGAQLDSVMNYPFADAIIDFVRGGNGKKLINLVLDICENYPPEAISTLMNHIGTHDTPRIITRLTHKNAYVGDREWQSLQKLNDKEYEQGIALVKLAATIQYTLPGVPSLYYGDEIGLEGYGDPFCRGSFDWSKTDCDLTKFYRALGKIRKENDAFYDGEFIPVKAEDGFLAYKREGKNSSILIVINRTGYDKTIKLTDEFLKSRAKLSGKVSKGVLTVPPLSSAIIESVRTSG